jgi:hypothetical protein
VSKFKSRLIFLLEYQRADFELLCSCSHCCHLVVAETVSVTKGQSSIFCVCNATSVESFGAQLIFDEFFRTVASWHAYTVWVEHAF